MPILEHENIPNHPFLIILQNTSMAIIQRENMFALLYCMSKRERERLEREKEGERKVEREGERERRGERGRERERGREGGREEEREGEREKYIYFISDRCMVFYTRWYLRMHIK